MVQRVHQYADGGKVVRSEGGGKAASKPASPKRRGDTTLSPKPTSTTDTLQNQRARQMRSLGLKDGGRVTSKAKPNSRAPLGQGGRFAAVERAAAKSGARNPAAVAAAVGRKKYGSRRMAKMAAAGRKR